MPSVRTIEFRGYLLKDVPKKGNYIPNYTTHQSRPFVRALDLAIGTARCADLHGDLARRFIALEQRFAHERNPEAAEHEDLIRSRLEIEAGEPRF